MYDEDNTLAWLLQHAGKVELPSAKNIFGNDIEMRTHTIGPNADRILVRQRMRALPERSGQALHEADR